MKVKKKTITGEHVANSDNFNRRLKLIRRSLKYTHEEFSKLLDISKPLVDQYYTQKQKSCKANQEEEKEKI
ncbi:MAG: hypothetical protein JSV88_14745 [Candidatus Aminicenantes bacterium]|nr:MAG: hypothetical protein JSV88_14745 [Candidatus Aminicenantes bacterium]